MPDEPSTPEICDRPPEKHEQLSATAGNLTLSRPCKGLLLPFVDNLRPQIPPEKGLSQLRGSLCPDRAVGVRGWLAWEDDPFCDHGSPCRSKWGAGRCTCWWTAPG